MKTLVPLMIFLTLFCFTGYADVPPEPGYVFQAVKVILQADDDLSDYRFFVESPIRIEEILIEKGRPTPIDGQGRAGAARIGTLWAVPRRDLASGPDLSSPESLQSIRQALSQGQYHATKLVSLDFRTAIPEAQREKWQDPVYKIHKTSDGISASLVSGTAINNRDRGPQLYSTEPKSPAFWTAVVIGGLLTAAFIAAGAWFLRRARARAVDGEILK